MAGEQPFSLDQAFVDQAAFSIAISNLTAAWEANPYEQGYEQIAQALVTGARRAHLVNSADAALAANLQALREKVVLKLSIAAEMVPEEDCNYMPRSSAAIASEGLSIETRLDLAVAQFNLLIDRATPPEQESGAGQV